MQQKLIKVTLSTVSLVAFAGLASAGSITCKSPDGKVVVTAFSGQYGVSSRQFEVKVDGNTVYSGDANAGTKKCDLIDKWHSSKFLGLRALLPEAGPLAVQFESDSVDPNGPGPQDDSDEVLSATFTGTLQVRLKKDDEDVAKYPKSTCVTDLDI